MKGIKLRIYLVDKRKIFNLKAKYDPETRLAQIKRGLREQFPARFQVDPNHIYDCHGDYVAFIDNASRKSIEVEKVKKREITEDGKTRTETETVKEQVPVFESYQIHTDAPVDGSMKNTLDYLIEEKFWKSLIAKAKLPLSTILILLAAGGGIFYLIRDILLPIFGVAI